MYRNVNALLDSAAETSVDNIVSHSHQAIRMLRSLPTYAPSED